MTYTRKIDELPKLFPRVFSDLAYLSVNDGWYILICNLSKDLDKLITSWVDLNAAETLPEAVCTCSYQRAEHGQEWLKNHDCTALSDYDGFCICTSICSDFKLALPQITQAKEKFGSIRLDFNFYINGVAELERKYSTLSSFTCEICGNPGKTYNDNYWLVTKCSECRESDLKERERRNAEGLLRRNVSL